MSGGVVKCVQKQWGYGNLPLDAIWCCNTPPDTLDVVDTKSK